MILFWVLSGTVFWFLAEYMVIVNISVHYHTKYKLHTECFTSKEEMGNPSLCFTGKSFQTAISYCTFPIQLHLTDIHLVSKLYIPVLLNTQTLIPRHKTGVNISPKTQPALKTKSNFYASFIPHGTKLVWIFHPKHSLPWRQRAAFMPALFRMEVHVYRFKCSPNMLSCSNRQSMMLSLVSSLFYIFY